MNYLEHIPLIIALLKEQGQVKVAEEVELIFQHSFTSSELLLAVGHRLKKEMDQTASMNQELRQSINSLLAYCRSIGLYVR